MARENRGVMKNNLFLYLTEFFAGMSVMAVIYMVVRPQISSRTRTSYMEES